MKNLVAIFICMLIAYTATSQESARVSPDPKAAFTVIVGLSARAEEKTVRAIKKYFSETSPGIKYLGHCVSQKCVVVEGGASQFASPDAVVDLLKSKFGNCILGRKNESISDFYKSCDFATEKEYKYFKNTYR